MDARQLSELHTNQRLLVVELLRRGVAVTLLDRELELLEAEYEAHVELLLDRDGSTMPYPAAVLCGDKAVAKRLLERAGVRVPEGRAFLASDRERALGYAESLKGALVVKPCLGSHGELVALELTSLKEVEHAIDEVARARGAEAPLVIERHVQGREYRVFASRRGGYAALHRDPASVVGDGKSTIAELVGLENARRTPRRNSICPILLDETATVHLARRDRTPATVPAAGERVYVRGNSNLASGGMSYDVTDELHASVRSLAMHVLETFPGLPYAGIDIVTPAIDRPAGKDCYVIEVNSLPGLHMHHAPGHGVPRDVARMVADCIFPETAE